MTLLRITPIAGRALADLPGDIRTWIASAEGWQDIGDAAQAFDIPVHLVALTVKAVLDAPLDRAAERLLRQIGREFGTDFIRQIETIAARF